MNLNFYSLLILLVFFSGPHARSSDPVAAKGIINVSQVKDREHFMVKLNGEWEFYWNVMLRPNDFSSREIKPDYYGKVPSYWTDYPQARIRTSKEGFATYRLKVILPPGFRKPLGFDMPVFDSSYDMYIGDRLVADNGMPGKSANETTPEYRRNFFRYQPDKDTLEIVINVANFTHRRGGFWLPMKFGTFGEVQKQIANSWAVDWATISLLLGFSIFFLFFYLLYPKEKVMIFFCMATIGLALRPLFTSHFLISNLINTGWTWMIRFEYLDLYIIITGWIWYAQILYPSKYFKVFAIAATIVFSSAFILTFLLPVKIFSYMTFAVYPAMLILMIYAVARSIMGIVKKNWLDIIYFTAFILLITGGIHDIKVSLGKSQETSGYVLTYVVISFILIQTALLMYRLVKSFTDKEKLQNELEFMNRNLELLVSDRTQELKTRNNEIEKQSSRIALQNKQLSETIQLKNKIF